jgi:ABC-type uncharacterized transport system permease subunit
MKTILQALVIWQILMMPAHFAGMNKKDKADMIRIRIACWAFGWTGIGWLVAMCLAFAPAKPD